MARRRRDDNGKPPGVSTRPYGGLRDTPRTRSALRPAAARVADSRHPLDAIGGRFFSPDLSAFEVSSPFQARAAVKPAIARAAAPAIRSEIVSPSKRSRVLAAAKGPDPLAKRLSRAAPQQVESLGRKLTGVLARLSPVPVPERPRGKGFHYPAGLPSGTLREQLPSPLPSVKSAARHSEAREHAKRSPSVRDPQASTCKPRPEDNRKKGRGGGSSREFVPWCDRRR